MAAAAEVVIINSRKLLYILFDVLFSHVQFFKKQGVVGVKDEYQLFNQVTGLELLGQGEEFLSQVTICRQTS